LPLHIAWFIFTATRKRFNAIDYVPGTRALAFSRGRAGIVSPEGGPRSPTSCDATLIISFARLASL
jgi:hypothetical protein